jgi:hypothetical protein
MQASADSSAGAPGDGIDRSTFHAVQTRATGSGGLSHTSAAV